MPSQILDTTNLILFFGSLLRVSSILIVAPFFSNSSIPGLVKILVAFSFSFAFYPITNTMSGHTFSINTNSLADLLGFAFQECATGLCLGFITKLIFESMYFAYGVVGMQMGFNFSSLYDPHLEDHVSSLSQLVGIIATLLFITLDIHHLMISAIAQSFKILPLGTSLISKNAIKYILESGNQVFLIGLQLATPVIATIFILNISFGVVSRAVPQVNVIIVSFAVNILAGILVLLISLPLLGVNVTSIATEMLNRFYFLLRHLHG